MGKEIEGKIDEILGIVKKCPENLQEKCFELLFELFFSEDKIGMHPVKEIRTEILPEKAPPTPAEETSGDEIQTSELHTKVKALMKNGDFTIGDINNLFYKEGGDFLALYDDLKSTKMSDSQIRLTLLGSLRNALSSGEFKISIKDIRALCDTHKCLDGPNFAANFKNNKVLFTEEYKKGIDELTLSPEGKKEMIRVATEISR